MIACSHTSSATSQLDGHPKHMGSGLATVRVGWDSILVLKPLVGTWPSPFYTEPGAHLKLVAEGPGRQSCASTLKPWRPACVVLEKGA